MKLKTLLLSSAAAFAVVGGAQAADLSVAEPVDYVKICDAFGAGYWYIPGSDTCLKIGGYVRFDVNFHSSTAQDWAKSASSQHSASWDMGTKAYLTATAKSMTEYGPLTGYLALEAVSNPSDASNKVEYTSATSGTDTILGNRLADLDEAYLELGMLLVGKTGSIYDYSGGFTLDGTNYDSDNATNQVRLTWAMSGFGLQLGIEDPRYRWGTGLSSSYSMPNLVGNISWAQGNWSAKLSGGFAETNAGSGFGIQLGTTFKLDSIAPGDQLMLKAAWAQNEVMKFAASTGPGLGSSGSVWSMAASFRHMWAPTLRSDVTFGYYNQSASTGTITVAASNAYQVIGDLIWSPVTNFFAGVEGTYSKVNTASSGTWGVKVRLERDW